MKWHIVLKSNQHATDIYFTCHARLACRMWLLSRALEKHLEKEFK